MERKVTTLWWCSSAAKLWPVARAHSRDSRLSGSRRRDDALHPASQPPAYHQPPVHREPPDTPANGCSHDHHPPPEHLNDLQHRQATMAKRGRTQAAESSRGGDQPSPVPRSDVCVQHQCLACSKARGEKVFYPCQSNDVSTCRKEKKSGTCRRQHLRECVATKQLAAEKAQVQDRRITQGPVSQCAVCDAKGKLRKLDESIKPKWSSPNLCEECASAFEAVGPDGGRIKVCQAKSCLCADGIIGTSKCPMRGHRGRPSNGLFARNISKNKECVTCHRCRRSVLASRHKTQALNKDDLSVYTGEEVHHFTALTGHSADKMPTLDPEAAMRRTYFSEEFFPDELINAHVWLRAKEKEAGMVFPTSDRLDAHWFAVVVQFVDLFRPISRTATKEQTNPTRIGLRLIRALSNQIHHTSDFADIDNPTLEEWLKVLAREPFFETVGTHYKRYLESMGISFPCAGDTVE
jgi:hypothetical protein